MLHAQQVQHLAHDKVDEIVDGLRQEVEAGIGRAEGGAGEGEGFHIAEVDEVERHLAVADDEGAAFLEGDGRGAGEEVVAAAGGDLAQRGAGAREDDHAVVEETARGDDGADVLVGVDDELAFAAGDVFGLGERGSQLGEGEILDVGFVEKEAAAVVGDDEVDLVPVVQEEVEEAEGVAGAGGARDAEDEGLGRRSGWASPWGHVGWYSEGSWRWMWSGLGALGDRTTGMGVRFMRVLAVTPREWGEIGEESGVFPKGVVPTFDGDVGASAYDGNSDLAEGEAMSVARGLVGGIVGGALGAAVWSAITYFTHYELGIVAWLVGVAVGFGVAMGTGGKGRPALGVLAALLAFASIFGGKLATAHFAAQDFIHDGGKDWDETDAFQCYVDKVALEYEGNGTDLSAPQDDEAYPPEVMKEAEARWAGMSASERESFMVSWVAERRQEMVEHAGVVTLIAFVGSMSPYDLLWTVLSVGTAYRLGARDARKKTEGEGVQQVEEVVPVPGGSYFASLGQPAARPGVPAELSAERDRAAA